MSMPSKISLYFARATTMAFLFIIMSVGVLFWIMPKRVISVDEKRSLAPLPAFSWDRYFSGAYTKGVDAYYADNFIFREAFIDFAAEIKRFRGFDYGGIQVYEDAPSEGNAVAKAPAQAFVNNEPEPAFAKIRSIIIFKGRAVQLFGAPGRMAEPFAQAINTFRREAGSSVRIYAMAVPVGADFYLPQAVARGKLLERDNIHHFYSSLDPEIITVPAYEELALHINEYIQFNTDHHWTSLGAYYAFRAFAEVAGFHAMPLSSMLSGSIPGFLGTLYYRTRSQELKDNGDHVDYYKVPYETHVSVIMSGIEKEQSGQLYYERASGGNAYGVFLGGDHPLMRVVVDNGSQRKIIVTKDSYGNAFTPYLASQYGEIFIVDYRYFKGSMLDLMSRYNVHEVLFAHNCYVINTPMSVQLIKRILKPR